MKNTRSSGKTRDEEQEDDTPTTIGYKNWVRDWRAAVKLLEDGAIEGELGIVMSSDKTVFVVLTVSLYDATVDGAKSFARTTSRDFDNKVAMYSHRTRDTGLARLITNKGTPLYVLRRGPEALEWASAIEGMPVEELLSATRAGATGRGPRARAGDRKRSVEELKEIEEMLQQRILAAEREISDYQNEIKAIRLEIERNKGT